MSVVTSPKRGLVRAIPALAISSVVLAALTACTGAPFAAACAPFTSSGPASSLVSASGPIGKAPSIDFPTPIISDGIQSESIIVGDGRSVSTGDTIAINYTLLNGSTGETLGSSGYSTGGDLLTIGATNANDVVSDSLECVTVGSRVTIVASALAVHGGQGDATIGVGPNDSIVYVIDVLTAHPAQASGAAQPARAGLPAVVTAPDGTPGITIPRTAAPTEVTTADLVIGSGDALDAGDSALIKFTSVAWESRSVVDSTWSTGRATIVPLNESSRMPAAVIDALIGTPIGSQVLVVIPADASGDPSGRTLVYVVDALGVIPAGN